MRTHAYAKLAYACTHVHAKLAYARAYAKLAYQYAKLACLGNSIFTKSHISIVWLLAFPVNQPKLVLIQNSFKHKHHT